MLPWAQLLVGSPQAPYMLSACKAGNEERTGPRAPHWKQNLDPVQSQLAHEMAAAVYLLPHSGSANNEFSMLL